MKNLYTHYARKLSDGIIPPTCEIYLTNECNQNCNYCNNLEYRRTVKSRATEHDYYRLLDELRDIKAVIITGGGEPTLFEGYERIVNSAIERGFLVSIVTNGTRLDKLLMIDNLREISWIGVDIVDYKKHVKLSDIKPNDEMPFLKHVDYVDRERMSLESLVDALILTRCKKFIPCNKNSAFARMVKVFRMKGL